MASGALGRRVWLPIALTFIVALSARAQQTRLSLDDIYDPDKAADFNGNPPQSLVWIDSGHYAWPRHTGGRRTVDWLEVDATTGNTQPLFEAAKMEAAIARLGGIAAEEARGLAHSNDLIFNEKHSSAILTIATDLYVYQVADDRVIRLTEEPGAKEDPSFSPNGNFVAFVLDNNLHVVDVATHRASALTTDGSMKVLNGKLDWVYEEEIYGRGQHRGYWWSPDSSRIAFLQIDDRPVSTFITIDDIPYIQTVETWDYPRAGEPNPIARLGIVRAAGGAPVWVDTSKYSPRDHLIVRVGWTPDGRSLAYEVQNRTQTWLDLDITDAAAASARTILRETSKFWISSEDTTRPAWLNDGSFLWLSGRSGWQQLYHYNADGTLLKQVTSGKWELRTLHGIDEGTGWIYFSGTERSHIGGDVYRIKLDGADMQRLSKAEGTHHARFSPEFAYYIDSWSDSTTPIQTRLHKNDGSEVRVIDENKVAALARYRLSQPEFLQVKTRDGFVMEAMMIKPPDFDPARRYPVYQFTYGGPHTSTVRNAWGGTQYMYHQFLAQHGIIVWICDNRTASGKGVESTWPVYKNFGELELRDIEDGLTWLKQQSWVDPARIGIHGWSYGGFLTSYALTHSTSFVMGIAGGTVADWRDYDTVYTERYMGLPQENPDGYRKSSPRWAARDLHGALLLITGAIDDNVHVSNTIQFAYELQEAQKPFSLMLYPKSRHGVTDPSLIKHLRTLMVDFIMEHLKPGEPARRTAAAAD